MRKTAYIVIALLLLASAAMVSHGPVVRWGARTALQRMSARLQVEIVVEQVAARGLLGVELEGVRIGPAADPLLTARRVRARIEARDLVRGRVSPERVEVEGPQVMVEGDGTLEGALRALVERARARTAVAPPPDAASSVPRDLPAVAVSGGRIVDRAGAFEVSAIEVTLEHGELTGTFHGSRPDVRACRLGARLAGLRPASVEVACERPFRMAREGLGAVEAGVVALADGPAGRWIEVRGARLSRSPDDRLPAGLDGALIDARVGLDAGAERPVEVALTVPDGVRLKAAGTLLGQRLTMRAEYDAVPLSDLHPRFGGTASGHVLAHWDFDSDAGDLELDLTLSGARFEHPKLGEAPVGPVEAAVGVELAIETRPVRRFRLGRGQARLGEVTAAFEADVAITGEIPRVVGRLEVGPVTGHALMAALPPGLMPNLHAMELGGTCGLKVRVDLDPERLKDALLDIDLDIDSLTVVRLPPALRLDRLRTRFETHFEMPDGEVITRVTGPRSDRWTPLEEIAPLMPIALLASEDGGFYGHGGVSLKHLRASLIANLQAGRFVRGGSTITMQLARNLFLHRRKTLTRKLEEIVVAWLLEREMKKAELLALYLNVVELGPAVFGIGDATQHYFGKTPAELTPVEIAWLVRLLPAPRRYYSQFKKRELADYYESWMQQLLDLLLERGHLTPEAHAAAVPATLWQDRPAGSE